MDEVDADPTSTNGNGTTTSPVHVNGVHMNGGPMLNGNNSSMALSQMVGHNNSTVLFKSVSVSNNVNKPSQQWLSEQKLPDETSRNFWSAFGETEIVKWPVFEKVLNQHFVQATQCIARPLSPEDLLACKGMIEAAGSPKDHVTLAAFASFWQWFSPFMNLVYRISPAWCSKAPKMIYGVLSRPETEHMLKGAPVGTFLLRFSSQRGCIAVDFVDLDGVTVKHTLITPLANGFTIVLQEGERSYDTLQELVMKCKRLTILYPNIDKAAAFSPATDDQPH
jgi:hypothetical protein